MSETPTPGDLIPYEPALWIDVPDPGNVPPGALLEDAENFNRLEGGVDRAHRVARLSWALATALDERIDDAATTADLAAAISDLASDADLAVAVAGLVDSTQATALAQTAAAAAVATVIDGAPEAANTLRELKELLDTNASGDASTTAALAALVTVVAGKATPADVATAIAGLAAVARTGSYVDLTNKPTIPSTPGAVGAEPAGAVAAAVTALAAVARTGSYSDLANRPTIPSTPGAVGAEPAGAVATAVAALAAVARTGAYGDLSGRPDLSGLVTKTAADATYQQVRTAARRAVPQRPDSGPTFVRTGGHAGVPFLSLTTQTMAPGKTGSSTFYWPFLIHARSTIGASALDEWYLLHSTDHDSGAGGIYLSTAPDWRGPWTGRGVVYQDTVSGSQTETPTAVWLPNEQLFGVLYQNSGVNGANGQQTTCLATSPTLLAGSFTRVGIAIDIPGGGAVPGNGHTGYASVHADGGVFYAHHLMGGTNPSCAGISQSADFRTWWTDPRPLSWAIDQIDGTLRLPWGGVQVVRWRGALYVIGTLTNGAAGTDPRVSKIFTARLAEDRRHIIGRPTYHLAPIGQETVNLRSLNATVTPDGELVLIYQCDDNFFLANAA